MITFGNNNPHDPHCEGCDCLMLAKNRYGKLLKNKQGEYIFTGCSAEHNPDPELLSLYRKVNCGAYFILPPDNNYKPPKPSRFNNLL
jgi:hypothetical protein